MKLDISILQGVCEQIATEIDAVVTIFGTRGTVIASPKTSRVGTIHEGAARITAGDIDSFSVTAEEAARRTRWSRRT
jgi:sugar diacid utilization regulator